MTLIERDGNVAIIVTTFATLDAEDVSGAAAAALLGVAAPTSWPPEHNGPATRDWVRSLLREHPDEPGFASWYLVGDGELVGTIGYKGPPDAKGVVEIGYSVIPERQRRGFAAKGVGLLLKRAFADERVCVVRAETLPDGLASQGVLRKSGFDLVGTRMDKDDGEVFVFERKRAG